MAVPALAENPPNVSLDSSETLFTVLTAINTCGYDPLDSPKIGNVIFGSDTPDCTLLSRPPPSSMLNE